MDEYLFRVSLEYDWLFKGQKSPVYAVARNEIEVRAYVGEHLKRGATIKSVALLGKRLGMNMYHGKPKRRKN